MGFTHWLLHTDMITEINVAHAQMLTPQPQQEPDVGYTADYCIRRGEERIGHNQHFYTTVFSKLSSQMKGTCLGVS